VALGDVNSNSTPNIFTFLGVAFPLRTRIRIARNTKKPSANFQSGIFQSEILKLDILKREGSFFSSFLSMFSLHPALLFFICHHGVIDESIPEYMFN
jgi:hypothetical protein